MYLLILYLIADYSYLPQTSYNISKDVYMQEVCTCEPVWLFRSELTLTFAEITCKLSYSRDKTKLYCGDNWQLGMPSFTLQK